MFVSKVHSIKKKVNFSKMYLRPLLYFLPFLKFWKQHLMYFGQGTARHFVDREKKCWGPFILNERPTWSFLFLFALFPTAFKRVHAGNPRMWDPGPWADPPPPPSAAVLYFGHKHIETGSNCSHELDTWKISKFY